ncbi:MAG: type III pantothenate kinase [Alteromonadaceae bacterium]|nr:type III pantothenate kinase [Alteromonadaceae bacterium]
MLEANSVLLLDIGNTNLKVTYSHRSDGDIGEIVVFESLTEFLTTQPEAKSIIFANVAKSNNQQLLDEYCANNGINLLEVKTEPEAFGIRCAYENYTTLGVDRWVAVLGAAQLSAAPSIIIDIGTAITVDFLEADQHLGGWIAPGFSLMKDSLIQNTSNVFADTQFPEQLEIGTSTEACVNQGCLAAIHSVVESAIKHFSEKNEKISIFLTGGGAKFINLEKYPNIIFHPKLVFVGLNRFQSRL